MERSAARRVGLESTIDAMRRGDLNRLKMLSVWARTRAQVALFEADDLSSLDLAIECLDGSMTHAERLTAPRGWEVVRLAVDAGPMRRSSDDLEALANAVREAARPHDYAPRPVRSAEGDPAEAGRRGHLRVLRSPEN